MNILLTGASGFLGRNISHALLAAGHTVRPLSRRHGIDAAKLLTAADWRPHLTDIGAVVNCIGIIAETGTQRFATLHQQAPIALFHACVDAGVRKLVQISAVGADDSAFSAYHLSKRSADEALHHCDLDAFILRPSLIYGHGGSSAAWLMRLARLPLLPVPGDGRQWLQPVHISDVVAAVVRCLDGQHDRQGHQTIDVVGPSRVTFVDWLQTLRMAQGKTPARVLHIPEAVAFALAGLFQHILPLCNPDTLRMLQAGYQADVTAFTQWLGRAPLAVKAELLFCDAGATRKPT